MSPIFLSQGYCLSTSGEIQGSRLRSKGYLEQAWDQIGPCNYGGMIEPHG